MKAADYTTIHVLKNDADKVEQMVPVGMKKYFFMSKLINNEYNEWQKQQEKKEND